MTVGLAIGLVVGFFSRPPLTGTRNASQAMDAASRDGLFQAKLDVESGRKPHLSSLRWSTNEDRALFIAGYQQAYQAAFGDNAGRMPKADAAEVAGYRDGIADGTAHQAASQSYQPERESNYINAGQASSQIQEDDAKYQQEYRRSYLNGYQEGYYSQQKSALWSYYTQQ